MMTATFLSTVIVLCISLAFGKSLYYTVSLDIRTQNTADQKCNDMGRHLASISNDKQNTYASNACTDQGHRCQFCWIGLEIVINGNVSYKWTDGTEADPTFIQQNLCQSDKVSLNDKNTNSTSLFYGYFITYSNCWSITTNSTLEICPLCGPIMFAPSGVKYWVLYIALPIILSIICLIYSCYVVGHLCSNLCIEELNWLPEIEPTAWIIRTAMILPFTVSVCSLLGLAYCSILCIGYDEYGLLPPISPIDEAYPRLYMYSGYICAILIILYIFVILPMGYGHILLRLKNKFDKNEFMRKSIPAKCRCFYTIMWTLIFLYTILPVIYFIFLNEGNDGEVTKDTVKLIIISIWMMIDISINVSLLVSYIKGLHTYAVQHCFVYQDAVKGQINDRQHQLVLEAIRYTVLFSMVSMIDIIFWPIVIFVDIHYRSNDDRDFLGFSAIFIKEMTLLTAIDLSFIFSHKTYEKDYCCGYCHRRMKIWFDKMVKKTNQQQRELQEHLLTNGL